MFLAYAAVRQANHCECYVFTQMYIKLLRQEEMEKLEQLAQDGYDSMLIDFNVGQRNLLRLLLLT